MRSAVDAAKRETALHRPAGDLGDAARDAIGSSIASSSSSSSQPQPQQGDTESERLLTEISRLRRHIAALEDTTDGSVERHQSELLALTTELQAEIDRLAHDNTALRRRLVLDTVPGGDPSRVKSVAELYSDILTLRADADAAFKGEDHLPRVVVVGDQSAGKTSVLEMIARARIFPRGAGEMMTRAPVQVRRSSPTRHVFSRFYFPSYINRAHQLLWHPLLSPLDTSTVPSGKITGSICQRTHHSLANESTDQPADHPNPPTLTHPSTHPIHSLSGNDVGRRRADSQPSWRLSCVSHGP
jgi:hypothetical protein